MAKKDHKTVEIQGSEIVSKRINHTLQKHRAYFSEWRDDRFPSTIGVSSAKKKKIVN